MPKDLWKRNAQKKHPQAVNKLRVPRKKKNDMPKSSARPIQEAVRQNLTLYDWMTVFAHIDTLAKPINQSAVVAHFGSLPTGALIFTQSTLSRKLKMRASLDIVTQFASEQWTLPEVHHHLMERLGDQYVASDWDGPLDAVLQEEDDVEAALASLGALKGKLGVDSPTSSRHAITEECVELEGNLEELISELKMRNRIFGAPPNMDELLDPVEERQVGQIFEGGDVEIIARVRKAYSGAEDSADSGSDDEVEELKPSLEEMMEMCRTLEYASIGVGGESGLEVSKAMRHYRQELQVLFTKSAVQTTLDKFFTT
jgi:hypothetical protein